MSALLFVALLLGWAVFGHADHLDCDELCTAAQLETTEPLAVTVDLGPRPAPAPVTVDDPR